MNLSSSVKGHDLINAARRKGRDAHDYKFGSAVFEDYSNVSPALRSHFLAMSVFNLKGSGHPDSDLLNRSRSALR